MAAQRLPKKRGLVFFHVMKTGGMTFRRILSTLYGASFHVSADPSLEAIESDLATYDCLEFHIMPHAGDWIHLHEELVRQRRWDLLDGRDAFVMLRSPVDQILSQFFFMQKIRPLIEPLMRESGVPFPESIDELIDQPAYLNNQVAFLVGKSQRWGRCVDENDLALAKDMLLRLRVHVGLTERFADSMNVFETVTGLKIPDGVIHNENQTGNRGAAAALEDRIKEKIRERSPLDLALYDFGVQLFEADLARCGPTPAYRFESKPFIGAPAIAAPAHPGRAGQTGTSAETPIRNARFQAQLPTRFKGAGVFLRSVAGRVGKGLTRN